MIRIEQRSPNPQLAGSAIACWDYRRHKEMNQSDQQHPRASSDREVIDRLWREGVSDRNLGELARLRIRYRDFPGARDLQRDLDRLLQQWHLDEEQLFEKTRELHASGRVYRSRSHSEDDWS